MTDILKSYSTLQGELDVAKNTLKGVDENIKRLIGRDPSELAVRLPIKRNNSIQLEERSRIRGTVSQNEDRMFKNSRFRTLEEHEQPPTKKRTAGVSVFKRLSDRPTHDDNQSKYHKGMISKVIVTHKEVPSRQERMNAQSKDAISIARNRRMFGALLGTLQKFQQEETKLKEREDKRAVLERKIEEHEIKEKEEIKKERQELFFNRKKKQAEIKMIELKMIRMKEFAAWEESQKQRMNFIYTKTKPRIHFLPRKLNEAHKALREISRSQIQKIIDKKREEVQQEIFQIEERGRKMYEPRKFQQRDKVQNNDDQDPENDIDDEDATMEGIHHDKEQDGVEKENSFIVDNIDSRTENNGSGEENNLGEIQKYDYSPNGTPPHRNVSAETFVSGNKVISNDSNQNLSEVNYTNYVSSSSADCMQQVEAISNINCPENGHLENNISIKSVDADE